MYTVINKYYAYTHTHPYNFTLIDLDVDYYITTITTAVFEETG